MVTYLCIVLILTSATKVIIISGLIVLLNLQDRKTTMANSASARKRARQAVKRRLHNQALRSRMRTYIKAILAAVASGDKEAAATAYKKAVPFIDSAVSKGLIHKNKASRNKSRLNARVKAMA